MSSKRKKTAQSYDPYKDTVLSNLDDINACIKEAERSRKACLDGILKVTVALEETVSDPDIQCVALVRKAELLFIAHKHKYNLDGLPGDMRLYSIDRCIADCEKVTNDSTENSRDNPVYIKARELHYNAWKLKEDLQREEKTWGSKHSHSQNLRRYDPSKTSFKNVDMINSALLQDIVDCYKKSRIVCRMCYYKKHSKESINSSHHHVCRGSKRYPQKLLVIPASRMCDNLGGTSEVPILPIPNFLLTAGNRHKPFQICKNADHQFCENKASVGENRFAHSIEELVVWTIERHYDCSFMEYIEHHHRSVGRERTMSSPDLHDPEDVDTDELFSDEQEEGVHDNDSFEYHPERSNIVFESMTHIPQNLLLNIVECCRNKMREYCKWCYYRNNEQGTASRDHYSDMMICSLCESQWNPVKVIPSSDLCWNFGDFDFLPIAPWPSGKPKKDPFEYCKKKDHFRCFRVYVDSEFWYPHSVEEMVIWTVEREQRTPFAAYVGRHQTGKIERQYVAVHGQSSTSSSLSRSPALPPSSDSVEHRTGKENTHVNIEAGPAHSRPAAISSNKNKVLLENPPIGVAGPNSGIQGPSHKVLGPNQRVMVTNQGSSGPNQGTLGPNQGISGPNQGISGPNQGISGPHQGVPGPNQREHAGGMIMRPATGPVMDLRQPMNAVNNGGLDPTQITFLPYHQMYPPGGPRPMLYPSGIRPVMNFASQQYRPPPQGGHPQIPTQQASSQPYGMPPSNPYYSNYPSMFQASVAGHKQLMMAYETGGGFVPSQEPNGERDGPANETQSNSNKTLSGSVGEPQPSAVVREPKKTVSNGVGGTASTTGNKSLVSGGRKNYTVAPQSERRIVGAVSSGKAASLDSGVDGEVGRSRSSDISGGSLVVKASSGVPRLATKVIETIPKVFKFSEVNFKDMDDIPVTLIKSVALSFREKKLVCRMCFFGDRDLSEKDFGEICNAGEHEWLKPIVVIPGCSKCDNEPSFQQGEYIPIFPLPPVAMLKKCPNKNHHKCFTKALDKQLFQAHSVEELVAWLVESEKECSLEAYARELNMNSEPEVSSPLLLASLITSGPVSPLPRVPAVTGVKMGFPPVTPPPIGSLSLGAEFIISPVTSPGPIKPAKIADRTSVAVENVAPVAPPASFSANLIGWNPMMPAPQVEQRQQERKEPPAKPKKYSPRDVAFVRIEDVPPQLLSSVAELFKQLKLVCRVCFFMSNCSSLVARSEKKGNACKKDHVPWKPIRVIPKSPLCVNRTPYISILPLPKHMKNSKSPFEVCKKGEHGLCYAMSRDTNPWFPHTIEELVVWIVERESAEPFENIYTKYLPYKNRAPVGSSGSKAKAGISSTSSMEATNYSAVVAKAHTKAAGNNAPTNTTSPGMMFSPIMGEDTSAAGNSQPFDDVAPLNQHKTAVDSHVTSANLYMHSQQVLAPPPGYNMPFYPSQPMPHLFPPSFPFQGLAMTTTGPVRPIISQSVIKEQSDSPLKDEMLQGQSKNGEFSGTWNGKSEKSNGSMLRNAIWHDEDPLPESSTWSRAVGKKSDFQSLSPLHSLSQQSFESKGMDEIIHQSQVDDDSFQPYDSIKPPPVIPALVERRGGAKESEPSKMINYAKSPLQAAEVLNSSRSASSKGSDSMKFFDSSNPGPNVDNGGFLASAMAAAEEMKFSSNNVQIGGSPLEDIYHSKSNSPEDMIGAQPIYPTNNGLFRCLLCFQRFQTSDELKSHGSSDLSHLELCLLDSGHDRVWQYSPPPPHRSEEMKVCTVPNCVGPPQCSKPHNEEQLVEWRARLKHRQQRTRTGAHLMGQASPNLADRDNCVPISMCRALHATVSEPNTTPNNGYSWTIHIQGQNWLNLFGVTVTTTSSWTFKITHVEGAANSGVFHPHAAMWRAPLVRGYRFKQCLMLGSVQVTVKALPPGSGSTKEEDSKVSAHVLLDLGYKQCFLVELPPVNVSEHGSVGKYVMANSRENENHQQDQQLGLQLEQLRFSPSRDSPSWDSDFSDDLGDLNIEGEDLTLQHVPIEEWGCSLTD